MNKILPIVLIVLVLGAGAFFLMKKKASPGMPVTDTIQTTGTETPAPSGASQAGTTQSTTKEFTVNGNEFAFAPNTLSVNKGDMVKITFTNTGKYPHNFIIDDLNVKSKTVTAGQSDVVSFTADKAGSFSYYCGVDSHKEKGMTGTLTVK